MKFNYDTLSIMLQYNTDTGLLTIETATDCTILDIDEASSLAEVLRDWLLHESNKDGRGS